MSNFKCEEIQENAPDIEGDFSCACNNPASHNALSTRPVQIGMVAQDVSAQKMMDDKNTKILTSAFGGFKM